MNPTETSPHVSFLFQPVTVKLMFCPDCGIHTNHHYVKVDDSWCCWCGCEVKEPATLKVEQE
jgi:hypothetical protein